MRNKTSLKILLCLDIALFLIFIFYKGYVALFETDFKYTNIENIKKIEQINKTGEFSFVILGNIKSSIDIFDKETVKKINNDKSLSFVISTGNALIDGSEEKYRMLNKSFKKILIPTIAGIGDKEVSDSGSMRFYKHYGPFYNSFSLGSSYFILLDTTGETSEVWQRQWLLDELNHAENFKYKFIIMNKPLFKIEANNFPDSRNQYLKDSTYYNFLTTTFSKYKVTAVFSSAAGIFQNNQIENVQYFISGGAGGSLILNNQNSFYHYIKVTINNNAVVNTPVQYSIVKQEVPSNLTIYRFFKNLWFYIHSIFYLNFFNYLLILCVLGFIGLFINKTVSKKVDYYTGFDDTFEEDNGKQVLTIAMFTNNYLPFIGGVPISITRLTKGLESEGANHKVVIFAPKYPAQKLPDKNNVIRCKLLALYKNKSFNFHVTNIFSPEIEKEFLKYNFDVIHVHHPFWMGSKGLELGEKYGLPVVLTYHTRLEKYAHFLPFFKLTFENILSHKLIKIFSQKCDAIIVPANSAKEYLENIGVSREKFVLPTGVDFDYFCNIDSKIIENIKEKYRPKDGLLLCSVARLSEEKNINFLIHALKLVKANTTIPFKCIIIGDGPLKEKLLNTIETEGLEDTVELLGSMEPEAVCSYYIASDIFVFSSKSETQGMVLLEAMAGKCPVIAIRSSGIDDVIQNGFNGFKTKNNLEAWSEKLRYLMENPEVLKELSTNAYEFSKQFSLGTIAQNTIEVYHRALHHKDIHLKNTKENKSVLNHKNMKLQKKGISHEKISRFL